MSRRNTFVGGPCAPSSALIKIILSVVVMITGWAKLNGANAVSFVVGKYVLENFE